jgi:hypothetical protein
VESELAREKKLKNWREIHPLDPLVLCTKILALILLANPIIPAIPFSLFLSPSGAISGW